MPDDAERDPDNGTLKEPDTGTPPDPDTGDGGDLKAELEKWKREKRKWEERAKENAKAADKLAEYENANKSELERLTEAQRASDERAAKAERELARMRVAMRKGLTEAQAKRLVGDTDEELEADADELMESFQPAKPEESADTGLPRRPTERLRPGARPEAEPQPSPKDIVDRVMAETL